jgi:tetratricopeptide (TPR) repeat protein
MLAATHIVLALALFTAWPAAQSGSTRGEAGTGGRGVIRGRIFEPGGAAGRRIRVRLFFVKAGTDISVDTDTSGAFAFDRLIGGTYLLRIGASDRFEAVEERVVLEGAQNASEQVYVPIYLRAKAPAGRAAAGVVDASVPPAARAEWEAAAEALRRRDDRRAEAHLRRALEIHPAYGAARHELGMLLLRLRSLDEAVAVLREGVALAPEAFDPRLDLGVVLLEKRAFDDARSALDAAVRLDARSARARLYRGITHIGLKDLKAAEGDLRAAVDLGEPDVPLAHYYLGGIYMAWREPERAATELETYLRQAKEPRDAERLKKTIADLRGGR